MQLIHSFCLRIWVVLSSKVVWIMIRVCFVKKKELSFWKIVNFTFIEIVFFFNFRNIFSVFVWNFMLSTNKIPIHNIVLIFPDQESKEFLRKMLHRFWESLESLRIFQERFSPLKTFQLGKCSLSWTISSFDSLFTI